MAFNGFSKETFDFLGELRDQNNREWFEENRARYEAIWKGSALDFIDAMIAPMDKLDPALRAEARLNGSLRRINRDVRFSKDKTPYQTRLHLVFWSGGHPNKSPGFHLILHPDGIGFGAGEFGFTPARLTAIRDRIIVPKDRAELLKAATSAQSVGAAFGETDLVRLPKGYEAAGEWEHLLRRKAIVMRTLEDVKTPDWIYSANAIGEVTKIAAAFSPLLRWLAKA